MTSVVAEEQAKQRAWEDGFRKRYPSHPALTLIDGLSHLDAQGARAVEEMHVPFTGDFNKLVGKARELAHGRAGKDFSGLVTMVTRAALRAAPDGWQAVEIFRLGACADAALWAILAQDSLKPADYYALTRAVAVSIPEIKEPGGLPDKEEPVPVEVKPQPQAVAEVEESPAAPTAGSPFVAEAQRWADANPQLFAEFQKSKMGYVGGAFSYTCEKLVKDAGVSDQVGRGQRTVAAFAVIAAKIAYKSVEALPKIAAKWWEGREVSAP